MTDSELTNYFLTGIIANGPWMFGLALFIGAMGVPLPGTLFVLAVGAFIQQEVMQVSALLAGLGGAILGDFVSYGLGWLARAWIVRRWQNAAAWQSAHSTFARHGGLAIYLSRFLFTPLAIPINLVAGSSGYPPFRFLLYDISGEITWIILYGGLGYIFGTQWELVNEYMGNVSGLVIGLIILGGGVYLLRRRHVAEKGRD
ncbi:MAG: VTT domain-containing protein [Chloroflexi bacterium]|nr:VTT domain-containing protein [Chloroflexota bacterium]MBP8059196.1 VTT domain-containing protein [Chloroflexota bacterium]